MKRKPSDHEDAEARAWERLFVWALDRIDTRGRGGVEHRNEAADKADMLIRAWRDRYGQRTAHEPGLRREPKKR